MSAPITEARRVPVPAGSLAYAEARLHVALAGPKPNVQLLLQQVLADLAITAEEQPPREDTRS